MIVRIHYLAEDFEEKTVDITANNMQEASDQADRMLETKDWAEITDIEALEE